MSAAPEYRGREQRDWHDGNGGQPLIVDGQVVWQWARQGPSEGHSCPDNQDRCQSESQSRLHQKQTLHLAFHDVIFFCKVKEMLACMHLKWCMHACMYAPTEGRKADLGKNCFKVKNCSAKSRMMS